MLNKSLMDCDTKLNHVERIESLDYESVIDTWRLQDRVAFGSSSRVNRPSPLGMSDRQPRFSRFSPETMSMFPETMYSLVVYGEHDCGPQRRCPPSPLASRSRSLNPDSIRSSESGAWMARTRPRGPIIS